jgi:hypothetical protein
VAQLFENMMGVIVPGFWFLVPGSWFLDYE